MAEAILLSKAGDRFGVTSAGMHHKGVNPLTVRFLKEIGLRAMDLHSKPSSQFLGKVIATS